MKALRFGRNAAIAVIAVGALALTACGSDNATGTAQSAAPSASGPKVTGTLTGIGSSAQGAAMDVWKTSFASANQGATVQYSPDGSGAGRKAILDGSAQFAGSDAYLKDDELASSKTQCGPEGALNIPVYISPIAVAYNLPEVKELKLDAPTVAKIFRGEVAKWNDPAIAALNPDATLPDLKVTPVHRSDDSGTTSNFTDYLAAAAPEAWTDKAAGIWPAALQGENAKGTSGVVKTVTDTPGAVTYADDSAVSGKLGTAQIKVGGSFTKISADAAAKAVDAGTPVAGRNASDLSIKLDRKTTIEGAYPIVLVSFHVVCTSYEKQETVDLVKAFEKYVVSDAGQKAAAESAKSAPLSKTLQDKALKSIEAIKVKS
ncbi:phosphate ABC transporter substrate-binding protein PstS [Arthrobacter sp. AL08]|uniref:phosphate ABC transporter substrate-binding protein PstS n=1 Tax=Micrococcaceae TaxID=1268 RepID=UPI001CFF86D4|nr:MULTISPECIES: phosphate ABC transporter substrate-binding protein PstS [Micrococcaceae]MCB5281190.1 Phosphate-binding protein PstS 3 [Arthrobacter sp. ES1]MDI3240953.1 phosphate ABC transporter substrate-binding protein PstS [Arthrobacter sp. AL05]MDI3277071.1 phosphate ABC transporter substrate-binding protein PstS [Arthrobacter sp. AL08]MDJ0352320.1 phosphate ABC transporter substrate-binding protein PstS [Pseudarthrobacter sp. PH31-O2]WGZ79584.1 phosphate ABC transporter substrate-bindin